MLYEYKTLVDDLIDYTVRGNHEGGTAQNFDTTDSTFISQHLNNVKFKFFRRYEQITNLPDNITPILLVTATEQFLKGRVLYKGKFRDIRSILLTDSPDPNPNVPKANFFVVPILKGTGEQALGNMSYEVRIYYNVDYDVYGFLSKEIDQILTNHYYKSCRGDHFHLNSKHSTL